MPSPSQWGLLNPVWSLSCYLGFLVLGTLCPTHSSAQPPELAIAIWLRLLVSACLNLLWLLLATPITVLCLTLLTMQFFVVHRNCCYEPWIHGARYIQKNKDCFIWRSWGASINFFMIFHQKMGKLDGEATSIKHSWKSCINRAPQPGSLSHPVAATHFLIFMWWIWLLPQASPSHSMKCHCCPSDNQACVPERAMLSRSFSCCTESLQMVTQLCKDEYFTQYHGFSEISEHNVENKNSQYEEALIINLFCLKSLIYRGPDLKTVDVNSPE